VCVSVVEVATGEVGGSGVLVPGQPRRKRLRSAGHAEGFELSDDVIAAELGALEDVEEDEDSDAGESEVDEEDG
jgi:hypothetical protein